MSHLDHLDAETAVLAQRSIEHRLASIVGYQFCNYPAADLVLDKLEVLYYNVASGLHRGMGIFAASDMGKSWIVEHLARYKHAPFKTRQGAPVHPVVLVRLPSHFKKIRRSR